MFKKISFSLMVVLLSACSILPLKRLPAYATPTPGESTTIAWANSDVAIATAVAGTLAARDASHAPPVVGATSPVGESIPANPAGTATRNAARTSVAGTVAVYLAQKGTVITPTLTVPALLSTATPTPIIPTPTLATPTITSTTEASQGLVVVPTSAVYLPFINSVAYPYRAQNGTPAKIPNFAHPEKGCAYLAVAGQTLDSKGSPVFDLVINAGGVLNGAVVDGLSMPGTALSYGPAGYEIQLAAQPVPSIQTLWVQLIDLNGQAVSPRIYFDTTSDCQQTVVLVNFQK